MNQSGEDLLTTTSMLDFTHPDIQALVEQKGWQQLSRYDAIGEIYHYVRDDILFGYNADDRLTASQVLKDGYGQCNTKGTLLMALLRAVGIPARFHGFTIYNNLQRGAIPNYLFAIAPERIIHSWVEVSLNDQWINLEGYIIDRPYLDKVQARFGDQDTQFSGYGIATKCLSNPAIDWRGEDTYIQSEGIADDFGVYAQPDDFYLNYGSNLSGIKKWLFRYLLRHLMNVNVNRIRTKGLSKEH
ncbi:transglutaminase-like domain-containing protein [Amphritea balenae]|uniref:Transglutaminase family protein n=1 Tax=Amphritea balenae TaxID=452629 RepID=A0A3P1SWN2_9GAMM|nr:transglutaminase family protein [Amphritea balenae]RRD01599.1 transglutaminase family protein [Amphritea balenae]GGK55647.1 transglutaminase [Amphritea balenae]